MGEMRIVGPGKTRGYPYPYARNSCPVDENMDIKSKEVSLT